ncbi:MAG TPA: hypothetical protein ENI63_00335 [Candidatus Kaiserbacteria bacterium]|nr:hypothetical protein [Candidatus Kaiserbacteria bacterium]
MEFLGSLGIDIRLLIAQIVNFGLLLWLLIKFLYRPIVKRIEKDEIELKQAQIQRKELEQKTDAFIEQKKIETAKAKERTQKIIKEAEGIAKEIKKEIHEKAKEEALLLVKQTKGRLESLRPEIEEDILENLRTRIGGSFKTSFLSALPLSSQKELQNILWEDFIKQIEDLTSQVTKKMTSFEVLEKSNLTAKKDRGKKELDKFISQKIGPVVLEYVYPLTVSQKRDLEEVVKNSGIKLSLVRRQNKNLINGFSFEFAGVVIESNLLNIINDATGLKRRYKSRDIE